MFVVVNCTETLQLFQSIFVMDRLNSQLMMHKCKRAKLCLAQIFCPPKTESFRSPDFVRIIEKRLPVVCLSVRLDKDKTEPSEA